MTPHPPTCTGEVLPKTVVLQVPVSHPQNQPVHRSLLEPKYAHTSKLVNNNEKPTFYLLWHITILSCKYCLKKKVNS
jgi:hypothetical protein